MDNIGLLKIIQNYRYSYFDESQICESQLSEKITTKTYFNIILMQTSSVPVMSSGIYKTNKNFCSFEMVWCEIQFNLRKWNSLIPFSHVFANSLKPSLHLHFSPPHIELVISLAHVSDSEQETSETTKVRDKRF